MRPICSPLVTVAVITYNQELYISKTIDGILSQKCDFDIEILIGEDYSSDNTKSICDQYQEKYPEKIKVLKREGNLGIVKNYFDTLTRAQGIYIAQCAGDDYWNDPLKLKKQVELLEKDSEVGLVYTQALPLDEASGKLYPPTPQNRLAFTSFEKILVNNPIPAPTICFRRDLFFRYVEEIKPLTKNWVAEDIPLFIWFAKNSKLAFISKPTAVYRILKVSASRPKDITSKIESDKIGYEEKLFYCSYYNVNDKIRRSVHNWYYNRLGNLAVKTGKVDLLKECLVYYRQTSQRWRTAFAILKINLFPYSGAAKLIMKIENRIKYIFNLV